MPALTVGCRVLITSALFGSMLWGAAPALADEIVGGGTEAPKEETAGDVDGDTISSAAGGIVYDRSKNGSGGSVGAVRPATNWTPPACWYAPKYTPAQLQAQMEPIWEAGSTGSGWDSEQRNRYVNGDPYKDFNKDKTGKGYFWDSYVDESYPSGWDKCEEPPSGWTRVTPRLLRSRTPSPRRYSPNSRTPRSAYPAPR